MDIHNGVIMAIKPDFCNKILSGEKAFEYRKVRIDKKCHLLFLYATAPISAVIGVAKINFVIEGNKENVWKVTKNHSGITKEYFDDYYKNNSKAYAYVLSDAKTFNEPVPLSSFNTFSVPQSFCYVSDIPDEITDIRYFVC